MTHNNKKTLKQAIDEINLKYYEEYRHYHNAHKRIIDYSPTLHSFFELVLIRKQYRYKKTALNYIKNNKMTNYLLEEQQYSDSTKIYTILEVF
jgi:hypothetical protein